MLLVYSPFARPTGGFRVVKPIAFVACFLAGWFGLLAGAGLGGLLLQLLLGSLLLLHPAFSGARGEQQFCHRPDRDLCSLGG